MKTKLSRALQNKYKRLEMLQKKKETYVFKQSIGETILDAAGLTVKY